MISILLTLILSLAASAATRNDVAPGDWAAIRAEYEKHKQSVYPSTGGYQARNLRQRWTTHFDGRGFQVAPDGANWRWGLALQSYGYAGAEHRAAHATAKPSGTRMDYRWDANLTEWFINDSRGLEHGFTLARRPEGTPNGHLLFHLAIRGTLRPRVQDQGRTVAFADGIVSVVNYAGLKVTDAHDRELPAKFVRDGDTLRLEVDDRGAEYPVTVDPTAQQAYLKPAAVGTTQASDQFGSSVAISGDTVVVGAPFEGSSSTGVNSSPDESARSGAVYVFVKANGVWSQQAYLKPAAVGTTQSNDQFGAAVAISGDTIVVGAPREDSASTGTNSVPDESAQDAGAAYVFSRNGATWSQQAYLKPLAVGTSQANDWFGFSVGVSGDSLVVGAPNEDGSALGVNGTANEAALGSGAAYVFARNSGAWTQQAYLKPAAVGSRQSGDQFGYSVGISGDTVVVGAINEASSSTGVDSVPNEDEGAAGAAYIFRNMNGVWAQQAYLKPAVVGTYQGVDNFGWSVAISGDTVVVGARFEDSASTGVNAQPNEAGPDSGAAYVFARNSGVWTQQAFLKPTAPGLSQTGDEFGWAVAVSGDIIVVGARLEDSSSTGVNGPADKSASDAGAAYVFARLDGAWVQTAYLKPTNAGTAQTGDQFGFSVSVSGDTVVVGAFLEDSSTTGIDTVPNESASAAGAAYVFTITPDTIPITLQTSPPGLSLSSSGIGCQPGSYTTPQTLTWNIGAACSLSVSTPQSGPSGTQFVFNQWDNASTNPVRPLTAPSVATTYTANFRTQYLLTTSVNPGPGGSVSPGGYFDAASQQTVTATPSPGYVFTNWSGDCSGTAPCSLTMNAPKSVTANFAAIATNATPQFTISRSAVAFNRATGRLAQTVTLINNGPALSASALAFDGLPSGVALYLPSGVTSATVPSGSPYRTVGVISAGATVNLTVEFTRTATQAVTYTPRMLEGDVR